MHGAMQSELESMSDAVYRKGRSYVRSRVQHDFEKLSGDLQAVMMSSNTTVNAMVHYNASRPPSQPPSRDAELKKKLFDEARKADEAYQEALRNAKEKLDLRSMAWREILDTLGSGPYLFDGKEIRIVVRPERKGKGEGETVFPRQINTKEIESI